MRGSKMDIMADGKSKKYIRAATYLLRKKLHTDIETMHEDLIHSGNPAVALVVSELNKAASEVKEAYQQKTVRELGELLLWIVTHDTAYRDIIFYLLYRLGDDTMKKLLAPYYKTPSMWYVNTWHDTKELTAKEKEEGKIPDGTMSHAETIFVPQIQRKRLSKRR